MMLPPSSLDPRIVLPCTPESKPPTPSPEDAADERIAAATEVYPAYDREARRIAPSPEDA